MYIYISMYIYQTIYVSIFPSICPNRSIGCQSFPFKENHLPFRTTQIHKHLHTRLTVALLPLSLSLYLSLSPSLSRYISIYVCLHIYPSGLFNKRNILTFLLYMYLSVYLPNIWYLKFI